jgi:hypothetical protein
MHNEFGKEIYLKALLWKQPLMRSEFGERVCLKALI